LWPAPRSPPATRTPASAWCRACGISARSARPAWTPGPPSPPDAGFSLRPAGSRSPRLPAAGGAFMAVLRIEGSDLALHLSAAEKIGAVHGDLRVPLAAVSRVEVL